MTQEKLKITRHAVLAGAYKGRDIDDRTLLDHYSVDNGHTALCSRAKHLADVASEDPNGPMCVRCVMKADGLMQDGLAKRGEDFHG